MSALGTTPLGTGTLGTASSAMTTAPVSSTPPVTLDTVSLDQIGRPTDDVDPWRNLTSHDADDTMRQTLYTSLFSDRRAEASDQLPRDDGVRSGWWADSFDDQRPFGSRLWLLDRSILTHDIAIKAKDYAVEATSWMVDDGLAKSVDIHTAITEDDTLVMEIIITKPDGKLLTVLFDNLWEALDGA